MAAAMRLLRWRKSINNGGISVSKAENSNQRNGGESGYLSEESESGEI
jgi:hypothetical protein